ncbi:MAG: hypothetical protein JRE81_17290 [Deltaproteobacteria bacterium]|nr:hypothetical protein [Deltaproteobacteria bacterium]
MKCCRRLVVFLSVILGCTPAGQLHDSTLESSTAQLASATTSGYPTHIVAVDDPMDASEALAKQPGSRSDVTYLVLTSIDAEIVWAEGLRDRPPVNQAEVVGRWVAPYLNFSDTDTALKAFVFGYLNAMHSAGLISWNTAVVPFLPPGSPGKPTSKTSGWGAILALCTFLLVVWSEHRKGNGSHSI